VTEVPVEKGTVKPEVEEQSMSMAKNKEIRKVTIVSRDSSAQVGPLCILSVGLTSSQQTMLLELLATRSKGEKAAEAVMARAGRAKA
jgi:hypothetical protein